MYFMKIFATTGDIQDLIVAPKTWRYNVFLNEKMVDLKYNFKQHIISCTVILVRSSKSQSSDSKSKIIDLVAQIGTDANKLTTSNETINSSESSSRLQICCTNSGEFLTQNSEPVSGDKILT